MKLIALFSSSLAAIVVSSVSGQQYVPCQVPNEALACPVTQGSVVCGTNTCPYDYICKAENAGWAAADCVAVASETCYQHKNCLECLTAGGCSWENGVVCTGGGCTSCVTPNTDSLGGNKEEICTKDPLALKPAAYITCPEYPDCNTCISSPTGCNYEPGIGCVKTCAAGATCITPTYQGLTSHAAICALPAAGPAPVTLGATNGGGNETATTSTNETTTTEATDAPAETTSDAPPGTTAAPGGGTSTTSAPSAAAFRSMVAALAGAGMTAFTMAL